MCPDVPRCITTTRAIQTPSTTVKVHSFILCISSSTFHVITFIFRSQMSELHELSASAVLVRALWSLANRCRVSVFPLAEGLASPLPQESLSKHKPWKKHSFSLSKIGKQSFLSLAQCQILIPRLCSTECSVTPESNVSLFPTCFRKAECALIGLMLFSA